MKPIRFSPILAQSKTIRSFRIALLAPAMMLTMTSAQGGTTTAPAAPPSTEASNWINFTIGGTFVSGDQAGMQRRSQIDGGLYGGIDSFQYTKSLNDSTTLTIDGHALFGLEDYEGNIGLTKNDVGYIKTGYKQYSIWYDGKGGFLSGAQEYGVPPWGDELSVERGQYYFEAGLRMDKLPEITFNYKHDFRNGQKDSIAWGEGIPSNTLPASADQYKVAPALWDIDEKTDTFELDIEHTLGNTDLGMGLVYEHSSYSNTRTNTRGYLSTTPPPSTTSSNAYREVSQTDEYTMDLFAGNIHSVTRFNDNIWLSAGFAYNTVDTDTSGSSRSISSANPAYSGTRAEAYKNTIGGGDLSQIIGNLNLMWVAAPDLTITPSLRYEHEDQSAVSLNRFYLPQTPATIKGTVSNSADSEKDETIGALDVRYTGLSDWVFYAKGQWGQTDENVLWRDTTATNATDRSLLKNDIQIDEQEYTAGANWYPVQGLSFAVQGLYADRQQSFDPSGNAGTGVQTFGSQGMTAIMMEHDTQLYDLNFRVTWRPMSNVSLVTRYDYSQTEFSNSGSVWEPGAVGSTPASGDILRKIESGETTSSILSESITWSPTGNFYLQATGSYIWSNTETPFAGITDSDNDYFSTSISAGYAIDDKTQLTGSFTYYGASNYNAYAGSMGYGLKTQEYGASLTLSRVINPNMVWTLRYGFITSDTGAAVDQSGGYSDFTAQMVSTGLQVRF